MNRLKVALILICSTLASLAIAGESKPFSQPLFDALTSQGKPVLVSVHADWCSTCQAQKPIIDELMKKPAYKAVTTLVVDFDTNKPTLKRFKVGMQSTLIAFKGQKEVGRSVGDTTKVGIDSLIQKTVN